VAEQHAAGDDGRLERGDEREVLGAQARTGKRVEGGGRVVGIGGRVEDGAVGVAHHPAERHPRAEQEVEDLARLRPCDHVAADHAEGGTDLGVQLVEHRTQRRRVAMDVVEGGDAHAG